MPEVTDVKELLEALATYRVARGEFLEALGCAGSNRDPFAEFAERIALAVVGGTIAQSRVQKGWDFKDPDGRRVQVRYVANPDGYWVNGHMVHFRSGLCERYALLVIIALEPRALLVFDAEGLGAVGMALEKRHVDLEHTLQLTQANFDRLLANPQRFAELGVLVVDLGHPMRLL